MSTKPDAITDELLSAVRQYCRDQRVQSGPSANLLKDWEKFHFNMRAFTWALLDGFNVHRDDREDCAQEVWLEVLKGLPVWRGPIHAGAFLCWLKEVARSKAVNCYRRTERVRSAATRLQFIQEQKQDDSSDDPVIAAERKEDAALLRHGLTILQQAVSPSTAMVIEMRFLEELPVPEICAVLQKTPQAVYNRERRGLAKLRTILARLLNSVVFTKSQE